MTRPRATQRRGVSLIEMLVVISIGTVVMGAVVTGTAALLRVNQRVHARADAGGQVERLATRLRADLREASQASWDAGTGTLSLVQADSSEIAYTCEGGRCLRTHGDAVLPYRLPTDATLHCPADAASEPGRFQVTVRLGEFRHLPVAVHLGSGRRLLAEGGSP